MRFHSLNHAVVIEVSRHKGVRGQSVASGDSPSDQRGGIDSRDSRKHRMVVAEDDALSGEPSKVGHQRWRHLGRLKSIEHNDHYLGQYNPPTDSRAGGYGTIRMPPCQRIDSHGSALKWC